MEMTVPYDERKHLLKLTFMSEAIDFTSEADWEAVLDHIEVHKYFESEGSDSGLHWSEAVFSWIEKIYEPLKAVVDGKRLQRAFPDIATGSLVFALSTHWYYLKEADPGISAADAAEDFIRKYAGHIPGPGE